jgi:hypothetical protein
MKDRFYTMTLVLGLAPGLAVAQEAPFTPPAVPADSQQINRDGRQQDREDQNAIRHDRDDQQRPGWGSGNEAGNLSDLLHRRYPESSIVANYRDNNIVVLTGNAASDRDRQDAEQFVRSEVGNARVINQIAVNGSPRM